MRAIEIEGKPQAMSANITPTNYHTRGKRPTEAKENVAHASNQKKAKAQDDGMAGIKTYRGAFDVSCITAKHPRDVVGQLVGAFTREAVSFR